MGRAPIERHKFKEGTESKVTAEGMKLLPAQWLLTKKISERVKRNQEVNEKPVPRRITLASTKRAVWQFPSVRLESKKEQAY